MEGHAHGSLGSAYANLGNFKQAIDKYELCLSIAKKVEDKTAEMGAYGNLGNVYHILGDFQNAKYYNKRLLGT